jgi:hypothetical protein
MPSEATSSVVILVNESLSLTTLPVLPSFVWRLSTSLLVVAASFVMEKRIGAVFSVSNL